GVGDDAGRRVLRRLQPADRDGQVDLGVGLVPVARRLVGRALHVLGAGGRGRRQLGGDRALVPVELLVRVLRRDVRGVQRLVTGRDLLTCERRSEPGQQGAGNR